MTIIHVGDGRHIELDVEAIFRPPQPVIKKRNTKSVKSKQTKRRQQKPTPERRGANSPMKKLLETFPGFREWWDYKNEIMGKYRDAGRKVGEVPGFRRSKMGYVLAHVKRKVKRDMDKIEKAYPDLDNMAKEALEGALEVLHGPQSQSIKLQAAKLLLEFTKSKPVAKSEVSINKAEEWLASLGEDE